MLKVVLTKDADTSLENIINYYLIEHSAELAEKVVKSIDQAFEQVGTAPKDFLCV